ncbi:VTT domain-containing protein [Citreicella sp. C3M06]|uniref:DedA family protein n=1 Tax=Roseobacteraceae TaxID=2854170 RepID=UPI001C09D4F7|nr:MULTISPECIES: VTT domain-containing protein [Roseobacteraceae]MBU2960823.1 VTT domain-containing protein [Citreicella sp. C3M06]MDO6584337.1 VTT domain-containing protein [Salipiger sp. 1_MG-2023]
MLGLETVAALIAKDGLVLLAPIAVLEGPIVTVIAAWVASRGLLDVWSVAIVVILADVFGDALFYGLGRWGLHRLPIRWRYRMGLNRARLSKLAGHFERSGVRTLIFGKWTHSAGAAVLVAAGLGRMPLAKFLWVNLIATIPKSLFFVAIGYLFGSAYSRIDDWIARISLLLLGVILLAGIIWLLKRYTRK